MGSACNLIWYCMSYKMAAYSLASDCIISHFSVADLPQTVPVAYWYAASLEHSFALPQICRRLFLWHTSMRQVWSKVSSCRRSAADCSCGILVCGKSAAKFHPAADLPQTVPVAYWYAASLQQNFFLPHTSAYSLPQTFSLRQVCGRSAAGLRHTFHFPMG